MLARGTLRPPAAAVKQKKSANSGNPAAAGFRRAAIILAHVPSGKQSKRRRQEQLRTPPPVGKQQPLLRSLSRRAWAAVALVSAVVAAAIVAAVVLAGGSDTGTPAAIDQSRLTGLLTQEGPWGPNVETLSSRLDEIGFGPAGEGAAMHIHVHLDVYADGKKLEVPANIGIDPQGQFMSPVHTHDTRGVVHVESAKQRTFTVGEILAVWGVRLTSKCLGGYCDGVRVYVDGKRRAGPPGGVRIASRDDIVVAAGTPPKTIPATYAFRSGE